MLRWMTLAWALSLICGCTTTLNSTRLGNGQINQEGAPSLSGLTYKLPAKRISLLVAYQITGCVNDTIIANVTPTISQSIEGDDKATFILNYQKLKAATKTQKLSVTLGQGGMLVAINSDNQDKTSDVITNTVSGALALARTSVIPGPNPAAVIATMQVAPYPHPTGVEKDRCEYYLAERIKNWHSLQTQIDAEKKSDDQRTKLANELLDLNLQLGSLKDDEIYYKQVGNDFALKTSREDERKVRSKIDQANQMVEKLGPSQLVDLQSKLAKETDDLTFIVQDSFVPRPDNKSLRVSLKNSDDAKSTLFGHKDVNFDCPDVTATVTVANTKAANAIADHVGDFGIAYRTAVEGNIVVRVEQTNGTYISQSLYAPIPQFGPISSLDLRNAPFEDTTLAINFDENGQISKLEFGSTAQAAAATAAFNTSTQSYLDFVQKVQADRLAATQQELALRKTQADTAASIAADRNSITTSGASTALTVSQDGVQTLQNTMDLRALQAGQATGATKAILDLQRDNQLLDLKIQNAQKVQQLRRLEAAGAQ